MASVKLKKKEVCSGSRTRPRTEERMWARAKYRCRASMTARTLLVLATTTVFLTASSGFQVSRAWSSHALPARRGGLCLVSCKDKRCFSFLHCCPHGSLRLSQASERFFLIVLSEEGVGDLYVCSQSKRSGQLRMGCGRSKVIQTFDMYSSICQQKLLDANTGKDYFWNRETGFFRYEAKQCCAHITQGETTWENPNTSQTGSILRCCVCCFVDPLPFIAAKLEVNRFREISRT
eukprot:676632-Hanusia_phi.AAC.1